MASATGSLSLRPVMRGLWALLALTGCTGSVAVDGGALVGAAGAPPAGHDRPSCAGRDLLCAGQSCCATQVVPGGTYNRLNDPAYPATVSDFQLDVFEVTVGRFRAFLTAFETWRAPAGSGALASVPGSGWDPSWPVLTAEEIVSWLRKTPAGLLDGYQTWTDAPEKNEAMPIALVTWTVAQEFCIWDGGRLPTEAEWNYAASGGSEQRTWAWGEDAPSPERVTFGWHVHNPIDDDLKIDFYKNVGSAPKGAGRWGHLDLNGSREELVFDATLGDYQRLSSPPVPCVDCAALPQGADPDQRVARDLFVDQTVVPPEPAPNERRELQFARLNGTDITLGFRCVHGGTVVESR